MIQTQNTTSLHPSSPVCPGRKAKNGSKATPDFAKRVAKADEPGGVPHESCGTQTGHIRGPRALPVGLHKDYIVRCLGMLSSSLQDLLKSVEDSADFDLGDIDVSLRMTELKIRTLRRALVS